VKGRLFVTSAQAPVITGLAAFRRPSISSWAVPIAVVAAGSHRVRSDRQK